MELDIKVLLREVITKCLDIREIVQRTELLQRLNELLPIADRIELPSFITNKYIDQRLYLLEEKYPEPKYEIKKTS